jgi:hypothetical protein
MEDFNMKTNYKRALKAMAKMEKRIYFDTLDSVVLVSESHFIISVPYEDWQELVEGVSSVFEKNTMTQIDLKKIFVDNKDGVRCEMTNAAIYCGDKLTRVFKAGNSLGVFNEKFLDVVRDTIHADYLVYGMTVNTTSEQIKSPMIHADFDANDKLISGVAILPINCNVRDVFNRILE